MQRIGSGNRERLQQQQQQQEASSKHQRQRRRQASAAAAVMLHVFVFVVIVTCHTVTRSTKIYTKTVLVFETRLQGPHTISKTLYRRVVKVFRGLLRVRACALHLLLAWPPPPPTSS